MFSRLLCLCKDILSRLCSTSRAIFGGVSWQAPEWLGFLSAKLKSAVLCLRTHPRQTILWFASISVAIGLITSGILWYLHLPKPVKVSFEVINPGLTRLVDEKWKWEPMVIGFRESVAPLDKINKVVTDGVEITPKIEGEWRWELDKKLIFTPKDDWAVGQEYTVHIDKKVLLRAGVLLPTYTAKFASAPFSIRINKSEFYQDPIDPNMKKVVVTVGFTHPVDREGFEKRVEMYYKEQKTGIIGSDVKKYKAHVAFDKFGLSAFLTSDSIPLPEKDSEMLVEIEGGTRSGRGGEAVAEKTECVVNVPSVLSFLRIQDVKPTIVDNDRFEPEQVIVVTTTIGVAEKDMGMNVRAYLLPVKNPLLDKDEQDEGPYEWHRPEEIDEAILKESRKLDLETVATDREYATLHSFKYSADVGRFVFLQIERALKGYGGYLLADDYATIIEVPPFPKDLKILQGGSVLSLGGERKISVYARDLKGVKASIYRILPGEIQHLITQTGGSFGKPEFLNDYNFNEQNISEIFTEEIKLPSEGPGKAQYFAIDLNRYITAADGGHKGLFLLRLESLDPKKKPRPDGEYYDEEDNERKYDNRFVLVTDLGVIAKKAADGSFDVFVQSIHDGTPVTQASVEVIGKNGLPVLAKLTDDGGHAHFTTLEGFKYDQAPSLFLVQKDGDLSFIPYKRYDRELNMSRFDIGGISSAASPDQLSAYLFSDRGLYRPGEEMNIGMIVKASSWKRKIEGVPLEVWVTDARGLLVKKEKIKLGAAGFEEFKYKTMDTSPTGTYTVGLYLIKDGEKKKTSLLGSVSIRVQEFVPDQMRISASLAPPAPAQGGWVSPEGLKGIVSLQNLFGTPASGKRIAASIELNPALPVFVPFKDFTFFDPVKAKEGVKEALADAVTDDKGEALFEFNLKKFENATYRLKFNARGFASVGGRSVAADAGTLVSPLKMFIGYKPDGDLYYIKRGSKRLVNIIAINPALKKTDTTDLKSLLIEQKYVSILTKQDDGTYKYESLRKEVVISETALNIPAKGLNYTLPTNQPGDFALEVRNANNVKLARIEYTVAGDANLARSLEKNAELEITLNKRDYAPGEEIELQIRAPYIGSGLITIERERVYHHNWFKTNTTNSVQKIKIPDGFEGNGYVSVAFVRDFNSNEIFTSPLSYGAVPFSVSLAVRTSKVTISSPNSAKPGENFVVKYKTDRPSKVVLFVVDEGILQSAGYKTPNPLGFFFQKRALEVRTSQILDLILPEFKRLMSLSSPGGDEEDTLGRNLNPFKRKYKPPVAFWSGIVDADQKERHWKIEIPDYFNGSLRVMAVAVSPDAIGVFQKKALVAADFVIMPNVPLFVTPGDEFDVTVGVTNMMSGQEKDANVDISMTLPKQMESIGETKVILRIPQGREATANFRLKAKDILGEGEFQFTASSNGKSSLLTESISIRPALSYMTTFDTGVVKDGKVDVAAPRKMYPEHRALKAGLSVLPLQMAHGLVAYLENFPYTCTEQLVSEAFSAMVLGARREFGYPEEKAREAFDSTLGKLQARQNARGSFGLWAASTQGVSDMVSVYALHFLLEAKGRGHAIPQEVIAKGMKWIGELLSKEGDSLADERVRAYAIYVLTRNGKVTTNAISALQARLDGLYNDKWKGDLAGLYLAASYQLIKQTRPAEKLLNAHLSATPLKDADYRYYYDGLAHDAQVIYIISRHFPKRLEDIAAANISSLSNYISKGLYNSFTASFSIIALDAYASAAHPMQMQALSVKEVLANGSEQVLVLPSGPVPVADFSEDAQSIRFINESEINAFYMVRQSGFDRDMPTEEIKKNLEVYREFTDVKGSPITEISAGGEAYVHLKMRSLSGTIWDAAIVELLPAGFEIVIEPPAEAEESQPASTPGVEEYEGDCEDCEASEEEEGDEIAAPMSLPFRSPKSTWTPEYADAREDRIVLYGSVGTDAKEFVYRIRATNTGNFTIPPAYGESMYDRTVKARGIGGKFAVTK